MSLVPEEVDLFESLVLNKPQTITFVPPVGENIKGDLTTNREGQVEIEIFGPTLFAKLLNECSADLVFLLAHVSLVVAAQLGWLTLSCSSNASRSCLLFHSAYLSEMQTDKLSDTNVAFLPIGLTFIIPLRNSTNVPLRGDQVRRNSKPRIKILSQTA